MDIAVTFIYSSISPAADLTPTSGAEDVRSPCFTAHSHHSLAGSGGFGHIVTVSMGTKGW